ncbi:uncharacterized protein LOC111405776 [Olea europaea var. sylvestris]|uniref:uncharacterized protein LOC111405776 n=1 Tax=Olea europaea var. sylvestris TaxID=158386 RepID=UPI000C1D4A9E|nr:uncharacterized protein LOC111405776 [Olea europaea var. sylvestris]
MTWKRLGEIRDRYSVPHTVEILVPEPNEWACYPRSGCVAVSEYLFKADKFKRKEYPAPDMATILKATTTTKARALKRGSSGAKEVQGKVERLSKDSTPKAPEEGASQRQKRPKEPREKEKVPEEVKRRKLVHVTISFGKFGTSVSHEAKSTGRLRLRRLGRRAAKAAEEEVAKQKPAREKVKSPSFLAGREETLAPTLVEALPEEVRSATENFTGSGPTDGSCIPPPAMTRSSEEKTASLAEEVKVSRVEAEEARGQKLEEMAKLESALAQIEALKKEVHESQCEMASLTKKVEVSNEHQKVTVEALEKANLSLVGAQESNRFLETQLKWYVDDASHAREEAQLAREEAVQEYVGNFHNTDEYKSFSAYWRNFAYAETPAEDVHGNEATEAGEVNVDAQAAEGPSTEAPPPSTEV